MPTRPPLPTGSSGLANWARYAERTMDSLRVVNGVDYQVDQLTRGQRIVRFGKGGGIGRMRVALFTLKRVTFDWLLCLPFKSGQAPISNWEESDLIKIAKPAELQGSRFDGKSIDGWTYIVPHADPEGDPPLPPDFDGIWRVAQNDETDALEYQQVIPKYRKNWPVFAVSGIDGGTDTYDKTLDTTEDKSDPSKWVLVQWLDKNEDARAFAAEDLADVPTWVTDAAADVP
jgi:hypothetical protein